MCKEQQSQEIEFFVKDVWDNWLSAKFGWPNMPMDTFVKILLAEIAGGDFVKINLRHPEEKYAMLPLEWRDIIMAILCANNGWREEFSQFIDMRSYFEDHVTWEMGFAQSLLNVADKLGKKWQNVCVQNQYFELVFTQAEVAKIRSSYSEETERPIRHFANLLCDHMYSRDNRENRVDYIARAYAKMHALNERKLYNKKVVVL